MYELAMYILSFIKEFASLSEILIAIVSVAFLVKMSSLDIGLTLLIIIILGFFGASIYFFHNFCYMTGFCIRPESIESIESVDSKRCMDVEVTNNDSGGNVRLWVCNGYNNQKFVFVKKYSKSGSFEGFLIRSEHDFKCLDGAGWSKSPGANVQQYECHGGENQVFEILPVYSGIWLRGYWIKSKHSGMCLDAAGWSKENGANIQLYPCHGGDNQLWDIR